MATRQELFTAFDLCWHGFQIGRMIWQTAKILQGLDINESALVVSNVDGTVRQVTLSEQIALSNSSLNGLKKLLPRMSSVFSIAPSGHLDAIGHFSNITRMNVFDDVSTSSVISANKTIPTTVNKAQLGKLAEPFEAWVPKVLRLVQRIEIEDNLWGLCIVNDLLDAMSYELHGVNSHSGVMHGLSSADLIMLIENRIRTARFELSRLPNSSDKNSMTSVVDYVDSQYRDGNNETLAQYIDGNIPKLVLTRRYWAL